ncbi:xylose-binding protein [Pelagirhabdus alkalitolerans]|uniref:Xylose-binding protein n=1 Tax=Pelagirhabdus alkalitolerans TaxID=1612202 RepID=A0A1G6M9R4_9BACI|nr:substrate-binding domain-containing protein [Pelagirhabdus alkalitolerans]SDC52034.1 xylose-binding protein [Pelagirhabdus alkalitolerans]
MRRLIKLTALTVISIIILIGCQDTEETSNEDNLDKLQANQEQPYVGFAMDTLQDERWYRDKENFETEILEQGGNVKTLAANGSQEVQNEQVRLLLEEGIDVLVLIPANSEEASDVVEMAHAEDVPVISYDQLVMHAEVDYYVSFDNVRVGELKAEAILDIVNEGQFAYVGGAEQDNNSHLLREGAMNILQPYIDDGDIELVYDEFTEDWSPDAAQENIEALLEETDLDAVVAANDGTAGGAINALGDQAFDVPVSGQDAELEAIRRIIEGTQTMTVYKSLEAIAERSAHVAMQLANNETVETDTSVNNEAIDVPAILLEPIPVDSSNYEDTVIEEGHIDESDL